MSYATFNGWNVIPMPTSPAPKDITLAMNDSVGQTQSPFSLQSQQQYWVGGDFWTAEVNLPPMHDSDARIWLAWLGSLRGKYNTFLMGDPLAPYPRGVASGPLVANGNFIAGAYEFSLRGFAPSTANVFLPGDLFQLYDYLYMVAGPSAYSSDSSGIVSNLEIWPSLRGPIGDGNGINIYNAQGIWRLADNKRSWSVTETKLYGLSFKAVEAR